MIILEHVFDAARSDTCTTIIAYTTTAGASDKKLSDWITGCYKWWKSFAFVVLYYSLTGITIAQWE